MKKHASPAPSDKSKWGPIEIAAEYFLLGALWILFSDKAAAKLAPTTEALSKISMYKGWGYVLVTAILLYWLIRRHAIKVREVNEKYRFLAENSSDVIWLLDPAKSKFKYISPSVLKLRGYTAEEVMVQPLNEAFVAEDIERLAAVTMERLSLFQAKGSGTLSFTDELTQPHRDGSTVPTEVTTTYFFNDQNEIEIMGVTRNITKRKQAEMKQRASEKKYQDLLDQASDGIFIADSSGRYTVVNEEACRLVGYTKEELLSMTIRDLVAPEDLQTSPLRLNELRAGKTLITERKLLRKDETRIVCEISGKMLLDGSFQSIVRDITERKVTEDALIRSEKRYRSLFENMSNGYARCQLVYDEDETPCDFIYLDVNNAFRRITGFKDLLGRHASEVIPGIHTSNPELLKIYGRVASTGHPEQFETYVPGLGTGTWLSISAYSSEKGFFVAVVEAITERKRAEEALRLSYEQLLSFIDHAPLSIVMLDRDMNYLAASRRWIVEYGRGYTDLIGRNHYDTHPDLPDYWKETHQRGLAGESFKNDDDLWVQADGTKNWLRWALTPWMDAEGKIGGIIISSEDISERKHAEAAAFKSELRYHRILDAMMEGCQIIDFDWKYVYVNEVVAKQGRHTSQELLNHTMMEMYPGIEQTEMFAALRRCMEDREPSRMENQFIFPDGSIGWFELSIQPAEEGIFILSTDITERKLAEQTIRDLARFPEENPNPVIRTDGEGQIIYANSTGKEWLIEWQTTIGGFLPDTWKNLVIDIYEINAKQIVDVSIQGRMFSTMIVPLKEMGYVNLYGQDVTKRKQAEQALQLAHDNLEQQVEERTAALSQANTLLQTLMDNIPDHIFFKDLHSRFIRTSKSQAKMLGLNDPAEVIGRSDFDFFPHAQRSFNEEQEIIRTGEPMVDFEEFVIWPDDRQTWVSTTKVPLRDQSSQIIGTFGIARDITARKRVEEELRKAKEELEIKVDARTAELRQANEQLRLELTERQLAEAALRESEERLRLSLKAAHQGLYDLNVQTGNAIVNREYAEMLGYDPDTFVETNAAWIERLHSNDREITAKAYSDYIQGLLPEYRVEFRQRTKGGDWKWILSIGKVVEHDADGKPLRMLGTHTDITQRKQIESSIQESERRYRELVQNTNSAILRWKRDGTIVFFNEYAQSFFGYTPEEILGKNVNILVPETETTGGDLTQLVENVVSHPEEFINVVNENICRDNRRVWMAWTNKPIYDENGDLTEILAVGVDITERKHAEDALRQGQEMFSKAFLSSPAALMITRLADGKFLELNEAYCVIVGYSRDELIGHKTTEFNIYRNAADRQIIVEQLLATGSVRNFETSIWHRSGEIRHVIANQELITFNDENCILTNLMDITERKQVEEQVRYQAGLLTNVSDAIISTDEKQHILSWNRAAEEMYGWSSEEVIGKLTRDVVRSDFADAQRDRAIQMLVETGEFKAEILQYHRNGQSLWVDGNTISLHDDKGNLTGFVSVNRNITERKQVEEKIATLAERLNLATGSANIGIWDWDIQKNEILWDDQMYALYGIKSDDFGGAYEAWLHGVHPEDQEPSNEISAQAVRGEREYDTEFRAVWPDGSVHWLKANGKVFRDSEGMPIRMVGVNYDITERKRSEEALHQSQENFARAFNSNPAALAITRIEDGIFLIVNESYTDVMGYPPEQVLGHNVAELNIYVYPEERDQLIHQLQEQGRVRNHELLVRSRSGEVRNLMVSMEPVLYDDRECILSTFIDITKRKQAEEEIQQLNEDLEARVIKRTSQLAAANKELESFSYSVSHDLRAPLRAIDGYTNILVEDYEPILGEEGKRVCGIVSRETKRMGRLIDDLLSFSRMGRREVRLQEIDMKGMVNSVLDELLPQKDRNHVELRVAELPPATGDTALMRQVWVNLLSNAIKFTSKKDRAVIQVESTESEEGVIYSVRDNGAGFEMEYANKLFGVFQRLHGESEFEGTGVGLAIVQRVVHRHGGRIWAEGKVGEGATFQFLLPKRNE